MGFTSLCKITQTSKLQLQQIEIGVALKTVSEWDCSWWLASSVALPATWRHCNCESNFHEKGSFVSVVKNLLLARWKVIGKRPRFCAGVFSISAPIEANTGRERHQNHS
jgi:hypothetical protein